MNVNGYQDRNGGLTLAPPATSDRLDSWKQIAVYLGREVRTVQRWEKRESLPVHRHIHLKGGTVYAFKKEINTWLRNRGQLSIESPSMHRGTEKRRNAVLPLPHETWVLFTAFRMCLALVAQDISQDGKDGNVSDFPFPTDNSDRFDRRPRSRRNARSGQPLTHG